MTLTYLQIRFPSYIFVTESSRTSSYSRLLSAPSGAAPCPNHQPPPTHLRSHVQTKVNATAFAVTDAFPTTFREAEPHRFLHARQIQHLVSPKTQCVSSSELVTDISEHDMFSERVLRQHILLQVSRTSDHRGCVLVLARAAVNIAGWMCQV